jgi:AcrR family transcriptional regulator
MIMPTRTRPLRAETRRHVLDAAFDVFGERGIAASSLADVAARAGLTKGAVYSNFTGKDDLVLALMEEHAMARLAASLAGFAEIDDPRAALTNVGIVLVRAMKADAVWHRLLAEYFALSYRDPQTREALRRGRREAREAVSRALVRLTESLGFEFPLPPDELAVVFFALSNGLAVESGIDPEAVPDDLFGRVLALIAGDAVATIGPDRNRTPSR